MIPLSELVSAFQALDLQVLSQPASASSPEQLFVVAPGEAGDHVTVQLLYLPGVEDPHLLQYYAQVQAPFPSDPDALLRFVGHLNPHLPVPGFEVNADQRLVYFRHVRVCAAPEPQGIVETALVALYLVRRFGGLVARAAQGIDRPTLDRDLAANLAGAP